MTTDGYLGEKIISDLTGTPYVGFTPAQWAIEFIGRWGGIDGDHHKKWVLDQAARILHGTPVIVKKASWDRGANVKQIEYRIETGEPSAAYLQWVFEMKRGDAEEGQEDEYDYDEGIAP